MQQPYRDNPPPTSNHTNMVEVETDDVYVEVFYNDIDGKLKSQTRQFIGHPDAGVYGDPAKIHYYPNKGSSKYSSWRDYIGDKQIVIVDDLIVPLHRVLKIVVKTTSRKEIVPVEKK